MLDHLDLEVTIQAELADIGLLIATIEVPTGEWGPLGWQKMVALLGEHLDVVERALKAAADGLSDDMDLKISPDVMAVTDGVAELCRSFRISPPSMAKTALLIAFKELVSSDDA